MASRDPIRAAGGAEVEFVLVPHPTSGCSAVRQLEVSASLRSDGLRLAYRLVGNIAALAIPQASETGPADGLWRHTCFEAFVAAGETAYREFNFSPSGQWAIYDFAGYRQQVDPPAQAATPRLVSRSSIDRLELEAFLANSSLPALPMLRLGVSAVVETQGGEHSFWALAHPGARPDFHDAAAFLLELPR